MPAHAEWHVVAQRVPASRAAAMRVAQPGQPARPPGSRPACPGGAMRTATALMHDPAVTEAPPSGTLIAGRYARAADYRVRRPCGTHDWLITVTHAGAGRYRHAAAACECHAGDVVVLAPGTPHDYATADDRWEFSWAHFTPRPGWSAWLSLPATAPGLHHQHSSGSAWQRIEGASARLVHDSQRGGVLHEELALNALEELLILLSRHAAQADRQLDPRVAATLERLSTSLAGPLSVAALASAVATSPSRLAHLFRAQIGEPITRMHLKLRLRHAARLLELTPRSVDEIAGEVGFASAFYFTRQFRAWYGQSPTAYRRAARQRTGPPAHQPASAD
jgi:AraC family transcriptional regulator of arabinose operon